MTSALKILPLVMLLVGCNFQHYPLSRPEDAKIDLRLAGVWRGELEEPDTPDEEPQTMYLAFIPFNERSFLVWGGKNIEKPYDLEGWEKHMSGRAFTTKIDGQLYLNMQLLSPAYVLNPTREQTDDVPDDGALAQRERHVASLLKSLHARSWFEVPGVQDKLLGSKGGGKAASLAW